jgi:hypothetical protein
MKLRKVDVNGKVIPGYHVSWEWAWECICRQLGIEEF